MATATTFGLTLTGLALTTAGVVLVSASLLPPAVAPAPAPPVAMATPVAPATLEGASTPDGAVSSEGAPGMAAHGRALFLAKGCATCHRHADVQGRGLQVGPDLTGYGSDPAFLRRWLQNPAAVRPTTEMPNLHLRPDEIEALVSFLKMPAP